MYVSDTRSGVLEIDNLNGGSKFHLNDLGTLGIFHAKQDLGPGDLFQPWKAPSRYLAIKYLQGLQQVLH